MPFPSLTRLNIDTPPIYSSSCKQYLEAIARKKQFKTPTPYEATLDVLGPPALPAPPEVLGMDGRGDLFSPLADLYPSSGAAVPRLNSQNLPSNFWAQLAKPRRTRECAFDRPDDIREAPQNASSPRGAIRLPWTFCLGIDPSPVRREGCSPRTGTQADALVFNRTPFLNPVPFDR